MRTKFQILAVLLLAFLFPLPVSASENTGEIPYPPRNFLYIVDCSGSMRDYGDALDIGRVMMRDLLPASTTTVIAFSDSASIVTDKLSFRGETSVLAGIEEADRVLKNQLQKEGVMQDTTVLLFSDMQSTVSADDGKSLLTASSFQAESERLQEIESLWTDYILKGDLRFYSLRWFAEEPDAYTVTFDPSGNTADKSQRFELDSTQEILKTCVEAYACVLTGNNEFQWTEPETSTGEGGLHVAVEESYRTFLYLPQVPNKVTSPSGDDFVPKEWHLPAGGCMLMLENTKAGTYILQGAAESCSRLTIPQPQLMVSVSSDPVMCFDKVAISVAMSAGDSYLGYDTKNSQCLMKICPPGEGEIPQAVPPAYREEKKCYEFVYTPQKKGEHRVEILYLIPGNQVINIKRYNSLDVEPYEIRPVGDTKRAYNDLRQYLQTHIQAGSKFSFSLSDYFQTSYRNLEFVVAESRTPETVCWEASSTPEGQVTIHALQEGSAPLAFNILYYDKETNQLDHTQHLELLVQVGKGPVPIPISLQIPLMVVIVVIVTGLLCLFTLHKRKD